MIERVISGGQIGGDLAGLIAATRLGIPTGGWMPKGFRTLQGPRREYAELYNCIETEDWRYPERTMRNVRDADATLRIARDFGTAGEKLTLKWCQRLQKPCYSAQWWSGKFDYQPEQVAEWLADVRVLNVAGNALTELTEPAADYLEQVLKILISFPKGENCGRGAQ